MAYTTIDNPELYFQTKLYTGDASATAHTLDGSENMQPDLAWFKSRSRADNHRIVDALRTTYSIKSNTTGAQVDSGSDGFTSLDADGFTLNGSGGGGEFNASSGTYVTWCWKAGTTSGITTTGANITPSAYSFNATSGFSIIKYEGNGTDGTNTAHALGAVPHMMIIKRLENANYWAVYHHKSHADPEDYYLILNASDARGDAGIWKDTPPTSVYFRHDNSTSVNANGEDMIAYLHTSIQGYSSFGGYTGNGSSTAGPFIYTGFRPACVITRKTNSTGNWNINDNKRLGYNVDNNELYPNRTDAEGTSDYMDLLSNGFKIRSTNTDINNSGDSYIYAAWAEAPLVNSEGVPCNAR